MSLKIVLTSAPDDKAVPIIVSHIEGSPDRLMLQLFVQAQEHAESMGRDQGDPTR
jgi:hypothetical protein